MFASKCSPYFIVVFFFWTLEFSKERKSRKVYFYIFLILLALPWQGLCDKGIEERDRDRPRERLCRSFCVAFREAMSKKMMLFFMRGPTTKKILSFVVFVFFGFFGFSVFGWLLVWFVVVDRLLSSGVKYNSWSECHMITLTCNVPFEKWSH